MQEKKYMETPAAMRPYIERIGAVQVGDRKWQVVSDDGKYPDEKAFIFLQKDGSIHCKKEAYRPTNEEAQLIKANYASMDFDEAILTNMSQVRKLIAQENIDPEKLFVFYTRRPSVSKDNVVMCQQRVDFENGNKSYLPWTFFKGTKSDPHGGWKRKEGDGKLPFFKPEKERSKFIMVHEGAKAARFAENLCVSNDPYFVELRKTHPYAESLMKYEHWGIIGGAMAPQRADFQELIDANAAEVVYFCDNDDTGRAALKIVSREYGQKMKAIKVEQDLFPVSWDIADEIPRRKEFWTSEGTYKGPSIEDMMVPATYATKMVQEGKKMVPALRRTFAEEWIHCLKPDIYCHVDAPWIHYSEEAFNDKVYPFSDTKKTSDLLKKFDEFKADGLTYDPAKKVGIILPPKGSRSNIRLLNMHAPSSIVAKKGSPKPFLEFMEYLIPVEMDREHVYRWIATLIAKPEIKMIYALLMISNSQGVGKTTLAEHILRPLVGENNVSYPTENDIVDIKFNTWIEAKRLAIIAEIYAGHSSKAANNLKQPITDRTIDIRRKYMDQYTIPNWVHIVASSNDERAIKVDNTDRRWLVPEITENIKPPEFWNEFYIWLNEKNGLGIIKQWATDYINKNGHVNEYDIAPITSRKKQIIDYTSSEGCMLVKGKLIELSEKYKNIPIVVLDRDFRELIKREIHNGRDVPILESAATIRRIAKDPSNGAWFIGERVRIGSVLAHPISNDRSVLSSSWTTMSEKARIIRLDGLDSDHDTLQGL